MQEAAQISPEILESISTPERVETQLGSLDFPLGVPTEETADRLYDHVDHVRAVTAFLDAYSGVSLWAARKGFLEAGIQDHDVMFCSEFMGPKTLVLTGNADTVYFVTFLDLTEGPLVVEIPPLSLCFLNDMWFRWVADPGMAGPDRGAGGRYLFVSPGHEGPLPEGGFFTCRTRTTRLILGGRSWRATTRSRRSSASGRGCASTATSPGSTGRASGRSSPVARRRRCRGPPRPGPPRSGEPIRRASSRAPGSS
ncbi:DUF1254 domain-containing protein [Streptomyces sp. NPDC048737]|uniref:DUF1254 domain-containing protein n=1 Tax=unclassified Streptomyces TaxID=2593676 RepID=UPI00341A959B